MVSVAHPALLLLFLIAPGLVWFWLRRPRAALPHPDAGLLRDLPPGRTRWAQRVGMGLRLGGLAALVLALAGPRWPDLRTRVEPEGIALMMVVDVSGSMAEPDFTWEGQAITRLEAVQRVFRLFVAGGDGGARESTGATDGEDARAPRPALPAPAFEGRATDLIGLVTFGTHPQCACPLTLSHSALLRILEAERPKHVPNESETNLSDAVALGLERLRAAEPRRKVLVLLSDGEHNVPQPESHWSPRQAAHVAAGLGIPIYTIDAGGEPPSGSEPSPQRRAGVQTLQEMARIAKGRSFSARDTASLLAACRDIDRLERTPISSFQYRRYHDAYPWLGLGALLAFATAIAMEQTVWRRLP